MESSLNVKKAGWIQFAQQFVSNTDAQRALIKVEHIELEDYRSHYIFLFHHVLSREECDQFIQDTESLGYKEMPEYRKDYRSNTRVIIPQQTIADELWRRIRDFVPSVVISERDKSNWKACGMNEQFRFCKYVAGQHFSPHFDSDFARTKDERSYLTFNIYLNDVPPEEGGATIFLKPRSREQLRRINPEAGAVLCFSHDIYHEGEMFKGKAKYLMRSDVMYKRQKEEIKQSETQNSALVAEALGREKLTAAIEAEARGDMSAATSLYKQAFKLAPHLEFEQV